MINAAELFNNNNIDSLDFEKSAEINVDFSNVCSIDFNAVNALLNLKKIALLNNKTLSLINANSKIVQMLDITGFGENFISNIQSVKQKL